jgi:ribosome-binding factor A
MPNISRLNELFRSELASAVNREVGLPDALITITYVDCSKDLAQAKIGFSILPDRLAGTALRHLKASTGQLLPLLRSRIKLRKFPHLIWEFDATEKEAGKIERLLAGLSDGEVDGADDLVEADSVKS